MKEYWGTFSIYDHRGPLYRQALLLFDRVVIPLPTVPLGDLTEEELEILSAEADYLGQHGAAIVAVWDPHDFSIWMSSMIEEGVYPFLGTDSLFNSRVYLSHQMTSWDTPEEIVAVPVFGSRHRHQEVVGSKQQFLRQQLIMEVTKYLPMPSEDLPLEHIIRIRESERFRQSITGFHRWQEDIIQDITEEDDEKLIRERMYLAEKEIEELTNWYSREMDMYEFKKTSLSVISLLSISTGISNLLLASSYFSGVLGVLSAIATSYFSVREVQKLSRTVFEDRENTPIGIIIEGQQLADQWGPNVFNASIDPESLSDQLLTCRNCGKAFTFSVAKQLSRLTLAESEPMFCHFCESLNQKDPSWLKRWQY